MQKLLASGAAALLVLALGGCETTSGTPGLGDESNLTDLSGLRLLGSDETDCDGVLQVDSEQDDDDDLGEGLYVESGANATFELENDDEDLDWACIGEDGDSRSDTFDCPDGATHVRITRAGDGDNVLFECYGA